MAGQPLWLRVVYRLERAVGEPVEKIVASDPYFDAVATARRSAARAAGALESASRRWLHLFNLPAGSDVRRLREQLARMDRRLVSIAKELEELEAMQQASRRPLTSRSTTRSR
jgi:hypothetical protein